MVHENMDCIDVALCAGAEQSQDGQGPARILEGSIERIAAAEMNVRELPRRRRI